MHLIHQIASSILAVFTASSAASDLQEITVGKDSVLFESEAAFYSMPAFSEDGLWLAVTKETESNGLWASEVLLMDTGKYQSRVAIPRSVSEQYATYSATAYSLHWEGSRVHVKISDGDVDSGTVVYDLQQDEIVSSKWNDEEDFFFVDRDELVTPISRCFPDWSNEVIRSGVGMRQAAWLEEGRLALFQARHARADAKLWLVDVTSCERTIVLDPGESRSVAFKGWLQGVVGFGEHIFYAMNRTVLSPGRPPEEFSRLILAEIRNEGIEQEVILTSSKDERLHDIGRFESAAYALFKPTSDFCNGRLFGFSKTRIWEVKIPDSTVCNVTISPAAAAVAFVVRASDSQDAPRRLVIARASSLDGAWRCAPVIERDIMRIDEIWRDCRERYGERGPRLFGEFSIADCMFAPVVTRFQTYGVTPSAVSQDYMRHVLEHPGMQQWVDAARLESEVIPSSEVGA